MPSTQRLPGKKAVILGAATRDNMAQNMARRFAREGAQIVIAGRHRGELEWLAGEIGGHAALCDITSEDEVQALAAFAARAMGGVDIAVNATGWGLMRPFLETTVADMDKMAAVQFRGPFLFFQEMVKAMTGGGSLIQISSVVATTMCHDHAAYMATKAATDHLIRIVADEFGARGIRANSISPALTATPMAAEFVPALECYLPQFPLGRCCTPDDISAAAVWLASDECFVSGENLQVNGGFAMRRHPTREEIAATGVRLSYREQ